MYRHVVVLCMAPPIVMGAWSIAFLLGQHVDYFLSFFGCIMHLLYSEEHIA